MLLSKRLFRIASETDMAFLIPILSHMIPVLPAQRAAAPVSQIRWCQQNGWLKTPELKKIPLRAAGQRTGSVENRRCEASYKSAGIRGEEAV